MFIAQELRKTNIAEYLLYMWQVEDTIRAFDFSLGRIRREYIDRFEYTEEQKEEEADWFGNLIRMMNQEGCREQGHLQINKVVMQQLQELNAQLLASSKFPFYNVALYRGTAQPRNQQGGERGGDLLQLAVWRHDAASAEEGDNAQYRTCRQGDIDLYRYAERLLSERQAGTPGIRIRYMYEYIDYRL